MSCTSLTVKRTGRWLFPFGQFLVSGNWQLQYALVIINNYCFSQIYTFHMEVVRLKAAPWYLTKNIQIAFHNFRLKVSAIIPVRQVWFVMEKSSLLVDKIQTSSGIHPSTNWVRKLSLPFINSLLLNKDQTRYLINYFPYNALGLHNIKTYQNNDDTFVGACTK